ncbi:uncharacterized protein MONBRDRAFT_12618 [Monosiga brevicollis MX1]|uniref:cystathionine gamma-lyase n=1 Tax=Monosiga brevicollis TaxID=81824 RepID=A9VCT5_MONBE|nr:uncharacterized protein MONBRDRAFT_12618 [Monosiga brevicollis MX1]EDQ84622.1 predicted protein [Monosiga brevicollis MX1]|eukprot:XP_001750526.1 hypothetical protein [Monosiga brevicollis MX1]
MSGFMKSFEGFATDAVHAGQEPENFKHWPCVPPISLATTFKQPTPGVTQGYEYSRGGNPTRAALETAFASICGGKKAFVWASGLAGTQAVLQLLKAGDHVLACDDLYGGTNRMLRRIAAPLGLEFDFYPTSDPEAFAAQIKPNTKLVWIESPTNPLLQVTDIRAVAKLVKAKGCTLVVDNTFMSAYFQRPLELGADIEFASVTKYYNGHSDVVMGLTVTKDEALAERLQFIQFAAGAVPSPFDCYLVNRGLKTLHLRMEAHAKNAMAVARYLEAHPKVTQVMYPGLPSHPNHEVAKSQATGFSGMVAFRIRGDLKASETFLKTVKVFTLAESLGAVESLAELPAIMTHASVPAEQRAELGISDSLIRLSVVQRSVMQCCALFLIARLVADVYMCGSSSRFRFDAA